MAQPYSASFPPPITNFMPATGGPIAEIVCSSADRPAITELHLSFCYIAAATGLLAIGVGYPATIGTAAFGSVPLVSENGADTSNSQISVVTNWTNPPIIPTVFLRRASMQA